MDAFSILETRDRRSTLSPSPRFSETTPTISKCEAILAAGLFALIFVLHWLYLKNFRWDSDEPQHLHLVWAWANGLLPYRDVFDNHSPLFHWLCSPVFAWLGERPDIVTPMRWMMVPLFLISLWCVYMLGATVFSPRVGLWAAVSTALEPKYALLSVEFRTDNLWTTLWLVALVVLLTGRLTPKRLLIVGLLFGAEFGVSMKTTVLALTVLTAGAGTWVLAFQIKRTHQTAKSLWQSYRASTAAVVIGLAVVPGLIVAFFASKGALRALYYCVFEHNLLPDKNSPLNTLEHFLTVAWIFVPIAAISFVVAKHEPDRTRALRKCFFLLTVGFFWPTLYGLWTTILRQTQMPGIPISAVAASALLFWASNWLPKIFRYWTPPLLLLLLAGLIEPNWTVDACRLYGGQQHDRDLAIIRDVEALTTPGQYVMDAKGETIFRRRPYYYAFEGFTEERIARGLLANTVPRRLVETRTAVCNPSPRFGKATLSFIEHNYLRVDQVEVAGKMIAPSPDGRMEFDVVIPQRYTLVSPEGPISGNLDGTPFQGNRELAAGRHEFVPDRPTKQLALFWARAWLRGYSPFKQANRL
jgi:Dolichyl-phosphate-mannose-protein mannosyltransferase